MYALNYYFIIFLKEQYLLTEDFFYAIIKEKFVRGSFYAHDFWPTRRSNYL